MTDRCLNCGGLLIGVTHQTVCLTNACAEILRLREEVDALQVALGAERIAHAPERTEP